MIALSSLPLAFLFLGQPPVDGGTTLTWCHGMQLFTSSVWHCIAATVKRHCCLLALTWSCEHWQASILLSLPSREAGKAASWPSQWVFYTTSMSSLLYKGWAVWSKHRCCLTGCGGKFCVLYHLLHILFHYCYGSPWLLLFLCTVLLKSPYLNLSGLDFSPDSPSCSTREGVVGAGCAWTMTSEKGEMLHPSLHFDTIRCHGECPFVNSRQGVVVKLYWSKNGCGVPERKLWCESWSLFPSNKW